MPTTRFAAVNDQGVPIKRDQIWQRDRARAIREEIWRTLSQADDPLAHARAELEVLRAEDTYEAQLHTFWLAVALLEQHADGGGLSTRELTTLPRLASTILDEHRVAPRRSRLSFLHVALDVATARAAAREGQDFAAAWRRGLALDVADAPLERDIVAAHVGGVVDAAATLRRLLAAELGGLAAGDLHKLRLARARLLRLTGAFDAAAALQATLPDDEAGTLAWERASLTAMRTGDAEPLARLARSDRRARSPRRRVELTLWAYASPSRRHLDGAVRVATLRRHGSEDVSRVTLGFLRQLERCYTTGTPLARRLRALGRALTELDAIVELDHRLLAWAAATRWLVRVRRRRMAAMTLASYRALSASSSDSDDLLGVMGELDLPVARTFDAAHDTVAADALPTRWRRGAELTRMAAAMGRAHARSTFARVVGRSSASAASAAELGDIASHFMGHLKGPLMKLGQMLSFYGFDVPAPFREALAELQDSAQGIPAARAIAALEREVGPIDGAFADFERVPIGVGTIGQVHRARLHDGRTVAVKIRYPGIAELVASDMDSLGILVPVLERILPRWDVRGLLDEIAVVMREECDYRAEASHQRQFRALLADDDTFVVPEVIDELSGETVLTTTFFAGLSYAAFASTATTREREAAASALLRYVVRTTVKARWFNTDLHPGNLLFDAGRIGLIDFGSVRRWDEAEAEGWEHILRAVLDDDPALFARSFVRLGLVDPSEPFDFAWAFSLLRDRALGVLTTERPMRLSLDEVRDEVSIFFADHPDMRKVAVPPRYAYGFRLYWGFFAVIAGLDVALPWRSLLRSHLDCA